MLHAAVVERNGSALFLPAMPGSGKSTLCAALTYRGWRLFSDEFGLIEPARGAVLPLPRAIPLKNRSIEVIRRFAPQGPFVNESLHRFGNVGRTRMDTAVVEVCPLRNHREHAPDFSYFR